MFTLVFIDNINDSFGSNSINNEIQIIAVSDSVDKLKEKCKEIDTDGCVVKWKRVDEQFFGSVWYDDEEEEQYYLIIPTEFV